MHRRALHEPCAWRGEELSRDGAWRRRLTGDDVAEIDAALTGVSKSGLAPTEVTAADFPLPGLSARLRDIALEVEEGRGLVLLQGLPVSRYRDDELALLWMGICSHLGRPVFQNRRGELLRAITDEGAGQGERYGQVEIADGEVFLSSRARTASTALLRFHTDRADIVALLCAGQAGEGGLSRIASSVAVHNEMLARRPDLAELLYQPVWRSRLGEESDSARDHYAMPVFGVRDGKFTSHYSRTFVEAAQLDPQVPRMSGEQWEALDLLADLADELCIEMRFEPGDMQFINNHVIYHSRTEYRDDPASGQVRKLLRVWLCPESKRRLPDDHAVLWRNVEAEGLRGGIVPG